MLGEYSRRNQYCYCVNCSNDWEISCLNKTLVGEWEKGIQKIKGSKTVQPYISKKRKK